MEVEFGPPSLRILEIPPGQNVDPTYPRCLDQNVDIGTRLVDSRTVGP